MIKFRKILSEIQTRLNEGPVGHMNHPFEDLDLTFGDLKQMIKNATAGKLEDVTEKLDGQNFLISWKDGHLIGARNKSHWKNFGEKALTKESIIEFLAGKNPNVARAFTYAFNDLEVSLRRLTKSELQQIFGNGKRFLNLEVIFPETQNVIPYGLNMLVFHNLVEYNQEGEPISATRPDEASAVAEKINSTNNDIQTKFSIRGPNSNVVLSKLKNYEEKADYYLQKLEELQGAYPDQTKVEEYQKQKWRDKINEQAAQIGYAVPQRVVEFLVDRWATGSTVPNILAIKKMVNNDQFKKWIDQTDKKDFKKIYKDNIKPFEELFLQLGSDVLNNASGFLITNPEEAVRKIAKNLETKAQQVKTSGDKLAIDKLKIELKRLKSLENKIAPAEGLAFYHNGKLYKLTGSFAPINQILGILRY